MASRLEALIINLAHETDAPLARLLNELEAVVDELAPGETLEESELLQRVRLRLTARPTQ